MALVYRADRAVIEKVMARLAEDGGIAPNARFREGSYASVRREVLLRDLDLLHMAGRRPIVTTAPVVADAAPLEPAAIERALALLKRNGWVAPDAYVKTEAPHQLAAEVGYRDFHFLYYLGQHAEMEICAAALALLKRIGAIDTGATYSAERFEALRQEVRAGFEIPDTAYSAVMERLLYLLTSVKRPRRTLAIGIFCGYTLAWVAGAACNGGKVYQADRIYGIDIDAEAIAVARRNFGRLADCDAVELVAEDGRLTAERLEGPFDYLYLDADSPENGKAIYLELLERLYPKLSRGAWVLAHDTTLPAFQDRLGEYLRFVRDRCNFSDSMSFDVDLFGLELSIK
jgi:predicted O-methyltransferase YrrM